VSLGLLTLFLAAVLSLFASNRPDGLEWSYAERPDQAEFETIVQSPQQTEAVDEWQERYALLPDYSRRSTPLGHTLTDGIDTAAGTQGTGTLGTGTNARWTSFAGVIGSILTMGLIWLIAYFLRTRTT
jgi:hypothetical protein